jgi:adenylate kinase
MQPTFSDVLETIETFSFEEKETLVDILQRRLQESKRQRVVSSVKEVRLEYERGEAKVATADEIMSEILS